GKDGDRSRVAGGHWYSPVQGWHTVSKSRLYLHKTDKSGCCGRVTTTRDSFWHASTQARPLPLGGDRPASRSSVCRAGGAAVRPASPSRPACPAACPAASPAVVAAVE